MSIQHLFNDLQSSGFALTIKGEGLSVVPAGRLTDSQREIIRQHKSELMELLKAKTCCHCFGEVLTDEDAGLMYCLRECEPSKVERRARLQSQLSSGEPSPEATAEFEYQFNERAGILEFEAGMTREESEAKATAEFKNYWFNHYLSCAAWLNDSGACEACQNQPLSTIASPSKSATVTA